jgi:hypothetical protein
MSKWLAKVLASTGAAAVMVGLLVSPAAAHEGDSLAAVRHATARFHDVDRAMAAGYLQAALPCFDKPGVGGMGLHYVMGSLIDGTVTATKPQALVYEVDGGELNLVAVEYLIPIVPANAAEAPRLFGQSFHPAFLPHGGAALNLWELHAWIWRHNPLGMFADYNPNVDLCPGPGESD